MTPLEKAQRIANELNRIEKELNVELWTYLGFGVKIDGLSYAFEFNDYIAEWVVKLEVE